MCLKQDCERRQQAHSPILVSLRLSEGDSHATLSLFLLTDAESEQKVGRQSVASLRRTPSSLHLHADNLFKVSHQINISTMEPDPTCIYAVGVNSSEYR